MQARHLFFRVSCGRHGSLLTLSSSTWRKLRPVALLPQCVCAEIKLAGPCDVPTVVGHSDLLKECRIPERRKHSALPNQRREIHRGNRAIVEREQDAMLRQRRRRAYSSQVVHPVTPAAAPAPAPPRCGIKSSCPVTPAGGAPPTPAPWTALDPARNL